jgi:hypothetical protein
MFLPSRPPFLSLCTPSQYRVLSSREIYKRSDEKPLVVVVTEHLRPHGHILRYISSNGVYVQCFHSSRKVSTDPRSGAYILALEEAFVGKNPASRKRITTEG